MDDSRVPVGLLAERAESADASGIGEVLSARFSIRTVGEARRLVDFLAAACPALAIASIGLLELFVNSVEHGNLGITFAEKTRLLERGDWMSEIERRLKLPEYRDRRSLVDFAQGPDGVRISIQDEGEGFDPTPYLADEVDLVEHAHGRGILLARNTGFASLDYEDGGRRVVVTLAP